MKSARLAELRRGLSRYLAHVRDGGTVLVLDGDHPVARIVPLGEGARQLGRETDRLARLERNGLLRRGTGPLPAWLGRRKPPGLRGSALKDLLRERESGW